MAVIEGGVTAALQEVELNNLAARIVGLPKDVGSLGAYSLALNNGTTVFPAGALTGGELFQFRWPDATRFCALRAIKLSFGSVTAFVAGKLTFQAKVARAFSVVGSGTGSAAAVLSTNNSNKKRTSQGASLLLDTNIVIAGTAALSAGTKTFDNNAFADISTGAPTTVGPILTNVDLWRRDESSEWPFMFGQNEGFSILCWMPGTGTMFFGVQVEWQELATWP